MVGRRGLLGAAGLGLVGAWGALAGGQEPAKGKAKSGTEEKTTRKALRPVPPALPSPPLKADERINRSLESIRSRFSLPGMVGAIVVGDALAAIGVTGVRKLGSEEPMRVGDKVHIGSDTKAMTATLLGMLVEEGRLSWSSTVRDVFPGRARELNRDFQGVTLWQLLTHRAGLPANGPWWQLKGRTTTEKRYDLLGRMMSTEPSSKPGTTFAYSNVGYAIAGLFAERVTGAPWEQLMRQRLFEPLGIATAGFGPPGKPGRVDEPWGHHEQGGKLEPVQGDNPPALGPAGTVHASMPDWAKFVALHLRGDQGKARLLKSATFRFLHTPPGGSDYAGGWAVLQRDWAGGRALTHSGSNTLWYCTAWLAPARDFAALVATNQGGDDAAKACDQSFEGLVRIALGMVARRRRG